MATVLQELRETKRKVAALEAEQERTKLDLVNHGAQLQKTALLTERNTEEIEHAKAALGGFLSLTDQISERLTRLQNAPRGTQFSDPSRFQEVPEYEDEYQLQPKRLAAQVNAQSHFFYDRTRSNQGIVGGLSGLPRNTIPHIFNDGASIPRPLFQGHHEAPPRRPAQPAGLLPAAEADQADPELAAAMAVAIAMSAQLNGGKPQ